MNPVSEIEFVVDEQYENEKGIFTVLSIHRNEMVIRWESGEEIRTDIELQRNIQARRQWERLQVENAAKTGKPGAGKYGSTKGHLGFNGFKASDFKNSASGTNWRGRAQLGGEVTRRLPESRFDFNSWAVGNKPEMHWLDTQHQKSDAMEIGAKFFLRVDHETMRLGLSIVRPDLKSGADQCWNSFVEWLDQEENDRQLLTLVDENNLTISNRADPQTTVLSARHGAWDLDDGKKHEGIGIISGFIGSIPETGSIDIEIAKQKDKQETLAAGKHIAEDVAKLFTRLMPLYHAAWPVLV